MEQKKKYVAPRIEVFQIETEGVLASSDPSKGLRGNSQSDPGVSRFMDKVLGK